MYPGIINKKNADILLVEDEILIGWSVAQALIKAGYGVSLVGTGEKAIEEIHSTHFDLVITDWKLPKINGTEVASNVKRLSPDIPVIMMSAVIDEASVEAKMNPFTDIFIEKPFDLKEIVELVNHFTGKESDKLA